MASIPARRLSAAGDTGEVKRTPSLRLPSTFERCSGRTASCACKDNVASAELLSRFFEGSNRPSPSRLSCPLEEGEP